MATPKKEPFLVHIRWMIRNDLPEVVEIEQASSAFPWKEEDFNQATKPPGRIGLVVESNSIVVAFMTYWLRNSTIEITNLAVHPNPKWRRHGIGSQIVSRLKEKLSLGKRICINVILRETNLPAQLFFKEQGFRATKVLRSFFAYTGEDGYLMSFSAFEPEKLECLQDTNRLAQHEE